MNKKFTKLMAAFALLMFLIPLTGWGQSDYSTDYSGNVTLSTTGGTSASDCKVIINNTEYAGIKAGTGSAFGAMKITVPANTTYLHLHVAAWNGENNTSLSVTPEGYSDNIGLTSNSGIKGNSPFTFDGDPSTSSYYKVITFSNALTEATELTFTATGGKRFVIWGVTSEEAGGGSNPEIQIAADELQLPFTANSDGHFNVTYTNDFEPYTAFAKLYNDAQGEEEFDGDWIEIIEEDLSDLSLIEYGVQANTGTSVRTVYLYVEAMDESTNVINAMFTITQAAQPTYTVTYAPNGGSGTMTDPDSPYHAGDVVVLMASTFTAPEGMIWDSWQVKDADDNEVEVDEGMFEMPASNVTVTAQWVTDPSGPQYEWVLTPLANLTENDIFVIVGKRDNNDNYYAMSNDNGTSTQPAAVQVTFTGEKLANAPANNIKWQFSGDNTDGYTFYPNGNGSAWLYCNTTNETGSNTNMRVGTGNRKLFVLDNNNYLVTKDSYTPRYVSLNNDVDWRGYVNTNQATTITFYKRQVASNEPSITLASYEVEVNANAHTTPTTIAVTYANIDFENDFPEVVFYEQDGSTETTYDWLFVDLDADWNVYYTIDEENTNNAARTAYFKVLGYDSNGNNVYSNLASITQAAAPVVYTTIPALFAAATSTETPVTITFDNWVISAVKGNNAYLTDNAGNGLIIYQSSHGFNVNDVLSGTASCNLLLYNGSAELKGLTSTTEGLTVTDGGTVDEINSIGINMLGGVNTGALLAYTNLTYDGTALVDADNNAITPYSTFYSGTFENGKKYNVKGIFLQYNTTKEILPRSADDIEEVVSDEPSITVTPINQVVISGDAGSGQLEVVYHKVIAEVGLVQFVWCNADGTTPADENYELWLNANLDDEDVTVINYMVGDNDGPARTAYFKIVGLAEDTEEVVESVVSFTQHQFKPDYAYLPYEFNGGRADIENENGLTQNGLGTDYAGNNPKLKFDGAGDYLVLKINPNPLYEYSPKAITFNIKGNSFSGGTFAVQVSEDGETYTDLATYDELGDTQTVTLLNTNDNVKYIRWNYIYKDNGNVGIGNIYVDDEYLVRGNATVSEDLTLAACEIESEGKLTIESGATFEVTEPYALYNGGNSTNLVIKDGGQLKTPNAVFATVEKDIIGYTQENYDTNKGYYLVSAPAEKYLYVASSNADVDAYMFDASEEGEEWRNFKGAQGAWNISASSAILYATKENSTLSLDGQGIVYNQPNPGANAVANKVPATTTNIDIDIRFNSGKAFEGYNLIGNPFTCTAYLTDGRDFLRMNEDGDGFVLTSGAISVCEGIFVVAESSSDNKVTFTTTNPTDGNAGPAALTLNLTQSRGNVIDNARIRFGEGRNFAKFALNESNARVSFTQGNKEYSLVRSNGQGEMPVNFKAAENGTYTLSIDAENVEMDYMHLIDNMTGADIDLLATPSYTFEARTSDYASRFRLVFSANNVAENNDEPFAFFNGSEWVVNASENATLQVMDLMGRIVVSSNGASNVSTNGLTAGVYMLRLIDGENVKTQKIVVR